MYGLAIRVNVAGHAHATVNLLHGVCCDDGDVTSLAGGANEAVGADFAHGGRSDSCKERSVHG